MKKDPKKTATKKSKEKKPAKKQTQKNLKKIQGGFRDPGGGISPFTS